MSKIKVFLTRQQPIRRAGRSWTSMEGEEVDVDSLSPEQWQSIADDPALRIEGNVPGLKVEGATHSKGELLEEGKADLQARAKQLGLSSSGTKEELAAAIAKEEKRLAKQGQ